MKTVFKLEFSTDVVGDRMNINIARDIEEHDMPDDEAHVAEHRKRISSLVMALVYAADGYNANLEKGRVPTVGQDLSFGVEEVFDADPTEQVPL